MTEAVPKRPLLIGKYLSPYVRRVGITLTHHGIEFDRLALSAIDDQVARERYNPTGRVPAVVLTSGKTLIDSAAILDYFDDLAGDNALVPRHGEDRRAVLQDIALATGTIDRLMAANAERRRPADRQIPERLDRLKSQSVSGFNALEQSLAGREWFGKQMCQSDITAAVALTFADRIFPGLVRPDRIPALDAMRARCEATPSFTACAIDDGLQEISSA